MQLAIIQTGEVKPQHRLLAGGDYPQLFKQLFATTDLNLTISTFRAFENTLPELNQFDAFLITGSRADAYADVPWINHLKHWITQCDQAQKKLIGICFGHQVIAEALGGTVQPSHAGWGVGIHTIDLIQPQNWMHPFQPQLKLISSHQDQVTQLPPQAQLLASSDFCPIQMFQIGDHIIGVQGHPEMITAHSQTLLESEAAIYGHDTARQGLNSLALGHEGEVLASWLAGFLAKV